MLATKKKEFKKCTTKDYIISCCKFFGILNSFVAFELFSNEQHIYSITSDLNHKFEIVIRCYSDLKPEMMISDMLNIEDIEFFSFTVFDSNRKVAFKYQYGE